MTGRKNQRGAATILMVALISLALSACLFGIISSVRGEFDTTLTAHQLIENKSLSFRLANGWTNILQQIYCGAQRNCQVSSGLSNVAGIGVGAKYQMVVASDGTNPINQSLATVTQNSFSTSGLNSNSTMTLRITSQANQSSITVEAVYSLQDSSSGKFNLMYVRYV